jgi:hypothetical protein
MGFNKVSLSIISGILLTVERETKLAMNEKSTAGWPCPAPTINDPLSIIRCTKPPRSTRGTPMATVPGVYAANRSRASEVRVERLIMG